MTCWTKEEQLCLTQAVRECGENDWEAVACKLKPILEKTRPAEWYAPDVCKKVFAQLVEGVSRGRRSQPSVVETASDLVFRKLWTDMIDMLKKETRGHYVLYKRTRQEMEAIRAGVFDDSLSYHVEQLAVYEKYLKDAEAAHAEGRPPPLAVEPPKLQLHHDTLPEAALVDDMTVALTEVLRARPSSSSAKARKGSSSSSRRGGSIGRPPGSAARQRTLSGASVPGTPDPDSQADLAAIQTAEDVAALRQDHASASSTLYHVASPSTTTTPAATTTTTTPTTTTTTTTTATATVEPAAAAASAHPALTVTSSSTTSAPPPSIAIVEQPPTPAAAETEPATPVENNQEDPLPPVAALDTSTQAPAVPSTPEVAHTAASPRSASPAQSRGTRQHHSRAQTPTLRTTPTLATAAAASAFDSEGSRTLDTLLYARPCPPPLTPQQRKLLLRTVWTNISNHRCGSIFKKPITEHEAPGYHESVLRAMDLQTIKRRVEDGSIHTTRDFLRDLYLMVHNALMYNSSDSDIAQYALDIREEITRLVTEFMLAEDTALEQMQQQHNTPNGDDNNDPDDTPLDTSALSSSSTLTTPTRATSLRKKRRRSATDSADADAEDKLATSTPSKKSKK